MSWNESRALTTNLIEQRERDQDWRSGLEMRAVRQIIGGWVPEGIPHGILKSGNAKSKVKRSHDHSRTLLQSVETYSHWIPSGRPLTDSSLTSRAVFGDVLLATIIRFSGLQRHFYATAQSLARSIYGEPAYFCIQDVVWNRQSWLLP